jgi:Protein of unknown function (DUF2911)
MWRRYLLVSLFVIASSLLCAAADGDKTQTTVCTFDDGKQISIEYPAAPGDKKLDFGQVWSPADKPIYLFSQAELQAGTATLPPKAYRVYLVPGKDGWTLILNDDVEKGAKHSKSHDVASLSMDTGKLPSDQKQFQMALGHTGPKQCSVRVYYGSTGAFAALQEK